MLAAALCFSILMAISDTIDVRVIFTALAVFYSLRIPMLSLAWSTMLLAQLRTMFERTQQYFDLAEAKPLTTMKDEDKIVEFKNASFKWLGATSNCLRSLNLEISKGSSTAIIGSVGCGKSSLISSIFSELELVQDGRGSAAISEGALRSIAYAPQIPVIISGTVIENICMNRPFDKDHFARTIQACSMTRDLELLPHGDQTDIGENGSQLEYDKFHS